jgi:hypothetical protein
VWFGAKPREKIHHKSWNLVQRFTPNHECWCRVSFCIMKLGEKIHYESWNLVQRFTPRHEWACRVSFRIMKLGEKIHRESGNLAQSHCLIWLKKIYCMKASQRLLMRHETWRSVKYLSPESKYEFQKITTKFFKTICINTFYISKCV